MYDFPNAPTIGQVFANYTWDGEKWAQTAAGVLPATNPPLMDATPAVVGVATKYAREDHVHPTDTSRAPLASPVFTGDPKAPTASAGDNDTSIATTAFVTAAIATAAMQCGILVVNSTTQIAFKPKNGGSVKIAGAVYPIPSAGVTAANTGTFVNGAGGSNLAANTNYLVCVFNNAGTLALDFITNLAHAPDTTAGNVGIEIKSGDNTRTVVGLIRTNASSQFVDSIGNRFCLSWFNRQPKVSVFGIGGQSTASASTVALGSALAAINWGDEAVQAVLTAQYQTTGTYAQIGAGIDGANFFGDPTYASSSVSAPVTVGGWDYAAEGAHAYGAAGSAGGGGTATLNNALIRVKTQG